IQPRRKDFGDGNGRPFSNCPGASSRTRTLPLFNSAPISHRRTGLTHRGVQPLSRDACGARAEGARGGEEGAEVGGTSTNAGNERERRERAGMSRETRLEGNRFVVRQFYRSA